MRWRGREQSSNVEDRRGLGGGLGRILLRGPGGIAVFILILVGAYFGIDLTPLLDQTTGNQAVQSVPYEASPEEQEMAEFTAVALKLTEDTWSEIFRQAGRSYTPPKLVLYTAGTSTGCGYGQSAMGPFYCPSDQSVYVDLSFYQDMKARLGGGGDFAQGYVIAHEVGHHVQHLLGTDAKVRDLQQRSSQTQANRLSVMLELQADCYAGVWGKTVQDQGILDPGDVQQALDTAEAIGDDRLQKMSTGRVVPDSFTHGTSQQRYTWFKRGFDSGNPDACDTFSQN